MLKQLHYKTMLLLGMMLAGAGTAWGEGTTATISFDQDNNGEKISSATATVTDSQENTWTITTEGTTSFICQKGNKYVQLGSKNSPATSITFTTTLSKEVNATAFSAKLGGFSGTEGTVTLKIDDTTVGTGSLNAGNDVTVSSTKEATGKTLTISITSISRGVKVYSISYTYEDAAASTDPVISVSPTTVSVDAKEHDGTLTVASKNIADTGVDIFFCEEDGTTEADYDWITADVNEDGNVDYLIEANSGAARTAYLRVFGLDAVANYVYSNIVTITQEKFVLSTGHTWDLSAKSYSSASADQVKWESDYATMTSKRNSSSATAANNYLGGSNNSSRFYKNSTLTISPAANYCVTSLVFEATTANYATALANSTWTNAKAEVENDETAKTYTVTVTPTDGTADIAAAIGATCGFTSVTVNYYEYVTVTMNSDGMMTFCNAKSLDFTGTGITAYTAAVSGTTITFTSIDKVPAKTGVLLRQTGSEATVKVPVTAAEAITGNALVGTLTDINALTGDNYYVLNKGSQGIGFYKVAAAGTKVGAGKAYLDASGITEARGYIAFNFVDETTAITGMSQERTAGAYYDLQGRRVAQPTRGLYVVNGKKVVVK